MLPKYMQRLIEKFGGEIEGFGVVGNEIRFNDGVLIRHESFFLEGRIVAKGRVANDIFSIYILKCLLLKIEGSENKCVNFLKYIFLESKDENNYKNCLVKTGKFLERKVSLLSIDSFDGENTSNISMDGHSLRLELRLNIRKINTSWQVYILERGEESIEGVIFDKNWVYHYFLFDYIAPYNLDV